MYEILSVKHMSLSLSLPQNWQRQPFPSKRSDEDIFDAGVYNEEQTDIY